METLFSQIGYLQEQLNLHSQSLVPIGTIIPYVSSNKIPFGYVACNGASVLKKGTTATGENYEALYEIIGDSFTSTPSATEFNLPDLRGRVPMGAGKGEKLTHREIGKRIGEEGHVLTTNEIPAHSHGITDSGHSHGVNDPGHVHKHGWPGMYGDGGFDKGDKAGKIWDGARTETGYTGISVSSASTGIKISDTGNGSSHNNIQPSTVVNFLIKWK